MFNFDGFDLIVIAGIILISLLTCCIFGAAITLFTWIMSLIFGIMIASFKLLFIIGFLIGLAFCIKLLFF